MYIAKSSSVLLATLFLSVSFSALAKADDAAKVLPTASGDAVTFALPSNYTLFGVTIRSEQLSGNGVRVTCDSAEIAIGGFCQEIQNLEPTYNALLTGGVASHRSVACLWKNAGIYRASVSCLSFKALVGDPSSSSYSKLDKVQ